MVGALVVGVERGQGVAEQGAFFSAVDLSRAA